MVRGRLVTCLVAVALGACGGSSTDIGDPPGDEPDAAAPACTPALEIGHCVDQATGEPCLDFEAAVREFVPLGASVIVPPVVGPQGSEMFVLAVRGIGIDPGTDKDPPRAELIVFFAGEERGRFTSFPSFFPDASVTDAVVAPQLFTVVFQASSLEGETIQVTGEVQNPSGGEQFCTETTFVCGTLIE